ncbi:hypothetical protein DL770_007060 [Monosporascus sp. CRB-9-2]|nr:hypothetical protein DL770_007060 [Monosporascus sp. CRB-9-2]
MDRNDGKEVTNFRAPNIDGKPLIGVDHPGFDIAYDTGVFPAERHAVQLAGCYLLMSYIRARPAELVGNYICWRHRCRRKDKSDEADDEVPPDEDSKQLNELLSAENTGRGRSKALCYEVIFMMIDRHPRTDRLIPVMAVNFIHHEGCDKKPRPTIFYFTPTKELIFCTVSIVIAPALYDQAFAAESLTDANRMLGVKT